MEVKRLIQWSDFRPSLQSASGLLRQDGRRLLHHSHLLELRQGLRWLRLPQRVDVGEAGHGVLVVEPKALAFGSEKVVGHLQLDRTLMRER